MAKKKSIILDLNFWEANCWKAFEIACDSLLSDEYTGLLDRMRPYVAEMNRFSPFEKLILWRDEFEKYCDEYNMRDNKAVGFLLELKSFMEEHQTKRVDFECLQAKLAAGISDKSSRMKVRRDFNRAKRLVEDDLSEILTYLIHMEAAYSVHVDAVDLLDQHKQKKRSRFHELVGNQYVESLGAYSYLARYLKLDLTSSKRKKAQKTLKQRVFQTIVGIDSILDDLVFFTSKLPLKHMERAELIYIVTQGNYVISVSHLRVKIHDLKKKRASG